ncbi:MAG: hypothetical protein L0H73_16330 [Nitrococcus sp.]|nr:hypothetical protein [Nitrococcus sp.]
MPSEEIPGGMSPTDLGKRYGLTPRQVNEILADAQLQAQRPGRSGWVPTSTGARFVCVHPVDAATPISWLPSAQEFITRAVSPVIRFIETQCYLSQHARTPLPELRSAYEKWSASEGIGQSVDPSIFEQLVTKYGAKCYPSPEGRVAVDLAFVEEASAQTRQDAVQQQAALDQIAQFIGSQCRRSATRRAPAELFYDAYQDWMGSENKDHPVGREEFLERLNYYGYPRQRDDRGVEILIGLQLIGRRPRLKVV